MRCGSYLRLPVSIMKKNACINVKNSDNQCLKWAVLSALSNLSGYKIHNLNNVSEYRTYGSVFNLKFDGLEFPIDPIDVPKFEAMNNLSINLYIIQFESNQFKILPIYLTSSKKEEHRYIQLLVVKDKYESCDKNRNQEGVIIPKRRKLEVLSDKPKFHYVWIKNLSRLVRSQLTGYEHAIHLYDRCLSYFHSQDKLKDHEVNCEKQNKCVIKLPSPKPDQSDNSYKIMKFKNYQNKEEVLFVVYADFESVLK